MNKSEARDILESVISVLSETGGEQLDEQIGMLIKFRDEWFNYAIDVKDEISRFESRKKNWKLASPYDLNALAEERSKK